jgi:hypothetical protein
LFLEQKRNLSLENSLKFLTKVLISLAVENIPPMGFPHPKFSIGAGITPSVGLVMIPIALGKLFPGWEFFYHMFLDPIIIIKSRRIHSQEL